MTASTEKDAAAAFIAALSHPDTAAAWRKAGFEPPSH
jgi:hypothetical protein